MKIAIIGSRNLEVSNLEKYLPDNVTEIVSGGANGRGTPLKRNLQIIDYSDLVIAFWDGTSRGTKYVIDNCKRIGKPIKIYVKNKALY